MKTKLKRFYVRSKFASGLLFAALICAVSLVLWKIFPNGNEGQTIAAWFQAIGSIGAIAGALWISDQTQSLEIARKRQSILAIAEAANEHARRINSAISAPDPRLQLMATFDKTIIEGIVGALGSIPAYEIGSRDGVIALLSLKDQFVFLGQAVEKFISGPERDPLLAPELERYRATGDFKIARDMSSEISRVLAQNVQGHIARIAKDYEALSKSINEV